MTQPAVSQQLADIESALGVPLFDRQRGLRPSASGQALLRYATQVLAGAHRLGDEVLAIQSGAIGLVRIGTMLVAATVLVPRALGRLQSDATALRLELTEDIQQGLWPRLMRGELDLVVGRIDAQVRAAGLPHEVLYEDPHVVVCGPAHPLATQRRPSWASALRHPWVLPPRDTALRLAIEASLGALGLPMPDSRIDSGSLAATQALLQRTDCLAVMSRTAARHYQDQQQLHALPLVLGTEVGPVGMAWRDQQPSPALQRVLQALRIEGKVLAGRN